MAYDNMVRHWKESDGEFGMPPVPASFDEDYLCIAMGKELGIPATEVDDLPDHWKFSVQQYWAWQSLESKRASRKQKGSSKGPTPIRGGSRGS